MTDRPLLQDSADPELLKGKRVAVLGYGSQGRAQALNLRDGGLSVVVGVRDGGPSAERAKRDGLDVAGLAQAVRGADLVAMLVPDMAQPGVFKEHVEPALRDGATLLFAHGFNVHYRQIVAPPSVDVSLVAPKAPGALVRRQYEEGRGVPCLVAVHQDATGRALELALSYAHHLGGTRAAVLRTTFAEETETDLFGEQAVLCGGATELVVACWETLVKAGYSQEVAYFECLHELKLIVDLLYEGGLERMLRFVSDTAKYGDFTRGPRVVDEHVRANLRRVLAEVQSGAFAREWLEESRSGGERFLALWKRDLDHPIEAVGRSLRERMAWLRASGESP